VYDFVGKVIFSKRTYSVNAAETSIKETNTYDHAGRLLSVNHSVNNSPDVMIDKNLHSTDNGTTFKQSVDHGGYRFTQSAAHLLSLVSGVDKMYIENAVIQERTPGHIGHSTVLRKVVVPYLSDGIALAQQSIIPKTGLMMIVVLITVMAMGKTYSGG
jgi:hypothetical protein